MNDLLSEINQNYERLTNSQKRIADYVTSNVGAVAFGTLYSVAKDIGVSTTSIIRFANRLGFGGFSEFRESVRNLVRGNISLPERVNKIPGTISSSDDLTLCFQKEIESIQKTSEMISPEKLQSALDMISAAESIYVLGLRTCFAPAFLLATVLRQIRQNVYLIQGVASTYPEEILNVAKNDVGIVFAYPRFVKETLKLTKHMLAQGAKIIMFTSPTYSQIKPYASIILPTDSANMGVKDSFVSLFCLINYITTKVAEYNKENSVEYIAKIENILSNDYLTGF